jgi:outer membrane immunogenic protein
MTMKKLLLGSAAFVALTAGGPAGAADLRTPVLKAPPVAAPVAFNWSRCYVGGHVGYGWGKNTNDFGTAVRSGPTEEPGAAFDSEFGPFNHNTRGGVLGGQVGCNHQWAPNWLVGVEGEVFWSGMKGQAIALEENFPVGDPGLFSRFASRNRWDADLALRLGFVQGSNLFYAKAGVAVGSFRYIETHDDFPTTHACPGVAFVNGAFINGQCDVSLNQTKVGWLVGLGIEHVLSIPNWTVKAEWNYIDYGTHTLAYPSLPAPIQSFPVKDTKNILKVGLNFYFP